MAEQQSSGELLPPTAEMLIFENSPQRPDARLWSGGRARML